MKRLLWTLAVIIILIAAFAGYMLFGPTLNQPEKKYFYISTGETLEQAKAGLVNSKIISGKTWFDLTARFLKYKTAKPGRYEIKKGMSVFELVRMLKNGRQSPVRLVITKLRTKEDFAGKVGSMFECDSTQLLNFINNNDSLKRYDLDSNTAIAAIMPYTYNANWNITAGKLFQKFYSAYEIFWNNERKQKAQSIGLSPVEVSTLASIIEEETTHKNDKYNIASVYLNRIAKGMTLQADPTIRFAMKNFELKRIYEKYLMIESPYNTYRNKGLPPGPICTPSIETIDAVLDAPKTDYLYFVASKKLDGSSIFTTDYNEHIKYAKEYQTTLDSLQAAKNR